MVLNSFSCRPTPPSPRRCLGSAPSSSRYLTQWRLTLASDLLADPSITLDRAAREVGYSTGYALSAAFKREIGVSPREYRRSLAA
jgi:AraC-like DNA-binding protein